MWYNMRSANDKAVCSRHMAANAAKQRTAHVTPQPKPALPVSLPLCGRQARMGLLLWYNNRKAVIIPGLCPTARRLRGNRLLMGNYTMPLRGHGIITAERLLYRVMPSGSPLARQPPSDGQLYHAASRQTSPKGLAAAAP